MRCSDTGMNYQMEHYRKEAVGMIKADDGDITRALAAFGRDIITSEQLVNPIADSVLDFTGTFVQTSW